MSSNIILNKSNIINLNKGNNSLVYEFPTDIQFNNNDSIAISSLNIYYSWFNITSKNQNNFFQYKFYNNNKQLEIFNVNITDGYYTIQTLHEYLQNAMVSHNHYVITPSGDHMYFLELLTNETYYSVQVKLSSISKMMVFDGITYDITDQTQTSGYRIAGTWLPHDTEFICPQLIIPSSNKFGNLIGFSPGVISYDSSNDIINNQYSILNNFAPNIEVQNSMIITCNLVENKLGKPNNIIQSFSAANTQFGSSIQAIHEIVYSKIKTGSYKNVELKFYDQNFHELQIQDPNLFITISFIQNND
jgi:hypothetical protein